MVSRPETLQRRLFLLLFFLDAIRLRELLIDQAEVCEHLEVVDSLRRALEERLDARPVDRREGDLVRGQEVLKLAGFDVSVVVEVFVEEVVHHVVCAELVEVHLSEKIVRAGSA